MKPSLSFLAAASVASLLACTSNVSLGGAGANLKAGDPCDVSACGPSDATALACLDGTNVAAQKCVAKGDGTCGFVANTCTIVGSDATALAGIRDGNGFTPEPPAGSACRLGQASYVLDLAGKKIAYTVCKAGATANDPYVTSSGSVNVTDAQIATVRAAFEGLTRPTPGLCAADLGSSHVEVRLPSKTHAYTDGRLQCEKQPVVYADHVSEAIAALATAAGSP